MTVSKRLGPIVAIAVALALSGCSADEPTTATEQSPAVAEPVELTVFAAASLTEVMGELTDAHTQANPEITFTTVFDGSSTLVTQLQENAQADLLLTADEPSMAKLPAELRAGDPVIFATNSLTIAVPPGNPAGIATPADLGDPDLQVLVCAPEVPCGAAAADLITAHQITPVSLEQNVKAVVTKLREGVADAGLVYTTDVKAAAGALDQVPLPAGSAPLNRYPAVVLAGSENQTRAQGFLDFIVSEAGQKILADHGFGPPGES